MKLFPRDIKPLFCVDITSDKNSNVVNGAEFITKTATKEKFEEYDDKQEKLKQSIKKSKLPIWLEIILILCGYASLIILFSCITQGLKVGFATIWENASILIVIAGLLGIVSVSIHILSKNRQKKILEEEKVDQQIEEIDEYFLSLHDELNVPFDAVEIDLLSFRYKLKNEEICPRTISALQTTPYLNVIVATYATSDELHIVDLENVYSFKKSNIKSIITVNKQISIPTWNKEEGLRSEKFKPYKLTRNNVGDIFFKPFYILKIEKDGQSFGICFPPYELNEIERLTGLTATANIGE